MKQHSFIQIISSLLVFLWVYASMSKLADLPTFTSDMHNQPLPEYVKPILIWLVPGIELTIAVLLIVDRTRLAGLYASLALMVGFTFYIGIILLHVFEYVPCSCGGIIKKLSWGEHFILNLFFVLISILGILLYPLKTEDLKTRSSSLKYFARKRE